MLSGKKSGEIFNLLGRQGFAHRADINDIVIDGRFAPLEPDEGDLGKTVRSWVLGMEDWEAKWTREALEGGAVPAKTGAVVHAQTDRQCKLCGERNPVSMFCPMFEDGEGPHMFYTVEDREDLEIRREIYNRS